ncbi:carbohydrate kinase family protein [Clostridium sp.]|uniref:carbohydrate kinase family protein n=1 Tax=Clostridium sp. TaxID=1506 RepID=UPI002618B43A|nr:carbohydrate kinase family protein [Clostridium sp.]
MCNNDPYILVLGASIVDVIGFCKKQYHERDSIPGTIKISLGGVCRNIAENLARINVNTEFISIVGGDVNGRSVLDNAREIGYSMKHSLVLKNECTPTYMAILNEKGEMESGIVDMESIDKMEKPFIDSKKSIIENAEYTVLGSDNPELIEYIVTKFKGKTRFILDPVSATKAAKVKDLVKYFHTIKPNRIEAGAMCGFEIKTDKDLNKAGQMFIDMGVTNVFISLDADGIYYKTKDEEGKIKTKPIVVKNVTGAGDSFVAGVGYGYMKNYSIKDTVKYAIAMSNITITHEDTINPLMSEAYADKYMESMEWIEY